MLLNRLLIGKEGRLLISGNGDIHWSLIWYFPSSKIWGSNQAYNPALYESETICTHQMKRQILECLKHTDDLCSDEAWSHLFRKYLTSLTQHRIGWWESCKKKQRSTLFTVAWAVLLWKQIDFTEFGNRNIVSRLTWIFLMLILIRSVQRKEQQVGICSWSLRKGREYTSGFTTRKVSIPIGASALCGVGSVSGTVCKGYR